MGTMRIRVTRRHISEGVRCNANACMVALAIREATGQPWVVDRKQALLYESNLADAAVIGCAKLSPSVGLRIRDGDLGMLVEPFSFRFTPRKVKKVKKARR